QEEALAGADGRRLHLALEIEAARQRGEHPVDRAAFLGGAGEIDAAQQRPLAAPAAAERRIDERRDERPHAAELLRETVDRAATLQVALFLDLGKKRAVESPLEVLEFLLEAPHDLERIGLHLAAIEAHAPHLRALLGVEFGKELAEAGEEIRLG